jgi:chitinase
LTVLFQLLLGLPLYGYVSQSTKTVLTGSLQPSENMLLLGIQEEEEDRDKGHFHNGAHVQSARNTRGHADDVHTQADLSSWWGQQIPFNALLKSGALTKKSDGTYGEGGGFTMGALGSNPLIKSSSLNISSS